VIDLMNGRQRNTTNAQIWGEKNDSNYDGNCTPHHCLSGTYKISRRWIFVGLSVHANQLTLSLFSSVPQANGGMLYYCFLPDPFQFIVHEFNTM